MSVFDKYQPINPASNGSVFNKYQPQERTPQKASFADKFAKSWGQFTAPARAVARGTATVFKGAQERIGQGVENFKQGTAARQIVNQNLYSLDDELKTGKIDKPTYDFRKKQFEQVGRETAGAKQLEGFASIARGATETLTSPITGAASAAMEPIASKTFESLSPENQSKVAESIQKLEEIGNENPVARDALMTMLELTGLGVAKKTVTAGAEQFIKQAPKVAEMVGSGLKEGVEQTPKILRPLEKLGEVVEESGKKSIVKQRENFIEGLVRPKETKKVLESEVGRTEVGGKMKTAVTKLSPEEEAMKIELLKIPELKKGMTQRQAYSTIASKNVEKAQSLEKSIKENDFIFPKKELISRLDEAKARLSESPTLTGDAQQSAEKIMNKFIQLVDQEGAKGSGLLSARKKLDIWIKSQKVKAFDAKTEGAFDLALKEIRQTANDFLDEKATSVAVKESLKEQSNLYRAMENLKPKAAQEAKNVLGRIVQNAEEFLGPNKLIKTIAGSAILTPAAIAAPTTIAGLTALGLTLKGGKMVITNPQLRIQLGRLLKLLSTKKGAKIGLSTVAIATLQDDIRELLGSEE